MSDRARPTRPQATDSPARPLPAADAAWLAVVPATAITLLAILVVGPWIGHGPLAPPNLSFWPGFNTEVYPEPVEQGRYVVALTAPLTLAALTWLAVRLRFRASTAARDALAVVVQALLVAFVVLCVVQQRTQVLGPLYAIEHVPDIRLRFFTPTTLLFAAAGTAAAAWWLGNASSRAALVRATRETRTRQIAAAVVVVAAIVVWLLQGAYSETTIIDANLQVRYHVPFPLDETFAVLDGRTPLVNFVSQYGSLWPYLWAPVMSLAGATVGVWIALALTTTGLGMLAIYAVLRRASGTSLRGLLLFLPVLATSFFLVRGPLHARYTFGDYFGTFPIRYAGPSLLAWIVARHLGGARPRRPWPLFLAAGLVVLNNADAGLPALGATLAALVWTGAYRTRASLARLALEAAAGLLAAYALVSAVTLARAGALPSFGVLMRFSRLFASGFGLFAMPTIGLHLVLYVTFVGAAGVATVRTLRGEPDRLLTGMLAWSGVFGLGAGAYFVGRSTPEDVPAVFFPWSFTLALLLVPVVRGLRVGWWRGRPPLGALACLAGFAVMACSLAQTPAPWEQLGRQAGVRIFAGTHAEAFVAEHLHRGEPAAILLSLGHRIGSDLGISNVSPYANSLSMPTVEQWNEAISALRAAGGDKLFIRTAVTSAEMRVTLQDDGFALTARDPQGTIELWENGNSS